MAKRDAGAYEFARFGGSVRVIGREVEITKHMPCESPAGACLRQAEQLRALTVLMSSEGFEVLDSLELSLKGNLMLLLADIAADVANLAALAVETESAHRDSSEVRHD